jgi:tagatose-6-phosphate ketose/aldose isomerase
MKYLGKTEEELKSLGGIHTAREIQQQPGVWEKIYKQVKENATEIEQFIKTALGEVDEIILTGAGTSAYIGICLESEWRKTGVITSAIPTTDIVTHPQSFFNKNKKVMLVSFARSGNSPESCAAVDLAEKFSEKLFHLVVTCNRKGELVTKSKKPIQQDIFLPEETNDVSLAMTSSFSGMLLAGLLVSRISDINNQQKNVEAIAKYGRNILNNYVEDIVKISKLDFDRAVFLGSGPLYGTAVESSLKLQELTDGNVICMNESFLAFRHGPKAVIKDKTIVVFILSGDDHAIKYEKDLVKTIRKENVALSLIGVSAGNSDDLDLDLAIDYADSNDQIDEAFLTVCSVMPAQILGFYKSINLGFKPDSPSASGTITRVVEKFVIHEK